MGRQHDYHDNTDYHMTGYNNNQLKKRHLLLIIHLVWNENEKNVDVSMIPIKDNEIAQWNERRTSKYYRVSNISEVV